MSAPLIAIAGLLALALRPVGWPAVGVTIAAGAAALTVPAVGRRSERRVIWVLVFAAGAAAFALVRLQSPLPRPAFGALGIAASLLAAVAEEALFRRVLYGWLERRGVVIAIAGSAVAFGLVHVPAYGWGALPVDIAAGCVFGWQRWATGGWSAPAATHVVANLVQVL